MSNMNYDKDYWLSHPADQNEIAEAMGDYLADLN